MYSEIENLNFYDLDPFIQNFDLGFQIFDLQLKNIVKFENSNTGPDYLVKLAIHVHICDSN